MGNDNTSCALMRRGSFNLTNGQHAGHAGHAVKLLNARKRRFLRYRLATTDGLRSYFDEVHTS